MVTINPYSTWLALAFAAVFAFSTLGEVPSAKQPRQEYVGSVTVQKVDDMPGRADIERIEREDLTNRLGMWNYYLFDWISAESDRGVALFRALFSEMPQFCEYLRERLEKYGMKEQEEQIRSNFRSYALYELAKSDRPEYIQLLVQYYYGELQTVRGLSAKQQATRVSDTVMKDTFGDRRSNYDCRIGEVSDECRVAVFSRSASSDAYELVLRRVRFDGVMIYLPLRMRGRIH